MTWIKICGTTGLADANLAIAAGADAVGFVFAPSPRQIQQEAAAEIVDALPAKIEKIGVTVNESPESAAKLAQNVGLTGIQLQGDEPADKLRAYRSALAPRKIIKTLQAQQVLEGGDDYLYPYLRVSEFFDAVLLDSGAPGQRGGTGTSFDWNAVLPLAMRIKQWTRVIIAGGLTPENVANSIRAVRALGSGCRLRRGERARQERRSQVASVHRSSSRERLRPLCAGELSYAGATQLLISLACV